MGLGTTVIVIITVYHCLDILLMDENKFITCLQGSVPGNGKKLHPLLSLQRVHSPAEAHRRTDSTVPEFVYGTASSDDPPSLSVTQLPTELLGPGLPCGLNKHTLNWTNT